MIRLILICCAIVVFLDIVLIRILHLGHGYFTFEELPAFASLLGFAGTLSIVVIAKILSIFISKGEDYYE